MRKEYIKPTAEFLNLLTDEELATGEIEIGGGDGLSSEGNWGWEEW